MSVPQGLALASANPERVDPLALASETMAGEIRVPVSVSDHPDLPVSSALPVLPVSSDLPELVSVSVSGTDNPDPLALSDLPVSLALSDLPDPWGVALALPVSSVSSVSSEFPDHPPETLATVRPVLRGDRPHLVDIGGLSVVSSGLSVVSSGLASGFGVYPACISREGRERGSSCRSSSRAVHTSRSVPYPTHHRSRSK